MAATKTAPSPGGGAQPAEEHPAPLEHLQHALDDLDHARKDAGLEARERIDAAVDCVRDAVRDVRGRSQDRMSEWEKVLERESDEVLVELGKLAVRMQRSPAALRQLSTEIRHRREQLSPTPAAKKRG
jgi:uncharacterized protein YicC (UPF0701 family)